MRSLFPRIARVAAFLLALAAPASAGSLDTAACKRDLMVAESTMRIQQDRLAALADASQAKLCDAWREHVRAAKSANAIYGRCLTDTDKRVKTAETASTAADFEQAIAGSCKGK
jgi:hypothetical protein